MFYLAAATAARCIFVLTCALLLNHLAGAPIATTTTLSALPATSRFGQPVTLLATISPKVTSGPVSFMDQDMLVGSANVDANGTAQATTLTLPAGKHTLVAVYGGDPGGSDSPSQSQPVQYIVAAVPGGSFTAPAAYVGSVFSPSPYAVVVADFNGDGKADLATSGSILLGNGDGTFQSVGTYPIGPTWLVVADFNGDGKADLAGAGEVSLGNGDGTFQYPLAYPIGAGYPVSTIAVSDLNGDGYADIAAFAGDGYLWVLLGNGDGTFQPAIKSSATNSRQFIYSMAIGDFNGDGKPDVVGTDVNFANVLVLLGNGDGTFQPPVSYAVDNGPNAVVIADFNNDGKLDFATLNYYTSDISVVLGNGDGTFQAPVNFPAGPAPQGLTVADFDGDGVPDLATTTSQSSLLVLLGNGDGTLRPAKNYGLGWGLTVVGDFNRDGRVDVAIAGGAAYDDAASVILGTSGTLQTQILVLATPNDSPTYGGPPVTLPVTASSGLPVTLTSNTPLICTTSGTTVAPVGGGVCLLTATQPGNEVFSPAPPVNTSLTVSPATQTLSFPQIGALAYGSLPIPLNATVSSGLPITYTASPSLVCNVTGNLLTLAGNSGTCIITAAQSGNSNYYSVSFEQFASVTSTLTPQTINFPLLPWLPAGALESISATSSSGLPVTFSSNTPALCTVSGSIMTNVAPGNCSITAMQSGNSTYAPASNTQTLFVFAPVPAFFTGEFSLTNGGYYLQFPDGNVFGYFNEFGYLSYLSPSVLYHDDLGFEAFVAGSGTDLYMYDFATGHWWYTSSSLFPYLYDFTLEAWLYYLPNPQNPGHYAANPRFFANLSTTQIFTQ
jgi:hypothetical protein